MRASPVSRDAMEVRLSMYGDRARLQAIFTWYCATAAAGLAVGVAIVVSHGDLLFAAIIVAALVPVGVAYLLVRSFRLEPAAVLLAVTLLCALTALSTTGLGIHNISNFGFAAVMIMTSLVTSTRTQVALVVVAVGCMAWLVFGELAGLYIPQRLDRSVAGDFFSATVVIVVTALLARIMASALYTNASRLQQELRERVRAEEEQERLRGQLAQAQKMESVGRLAGGVAHDFNNLLQVILGHADLALQAAPPGSELRDDVEQIRRAAEASARVTRQLLAFARRQDVVPRVVDLNAAISESLPVLRRLIGEDIAVAWAPAAHLYQVKIDPTQVEQVLTNLAANARDAIDGAGTVRISTANASPDEAWCREHPGAVAGDCAVLTVADSGPGLSAEVMEHLFEPFFTTKGLGRGTGLGLATVYGIVKQNGGFIDVHNAEGGGAVFSLYLPRCREPSDPVPVHETGEDARGTETVLLVEDEPAILDLAAQALRSLGYAVLPAASPRAALETARRYDGSIHLLLTDVIMPEMSGSELFKALMHVRPAVKALFMSGYTADAIAQRGIVDEGLHFLQKPFSRRELSTTVRAVLDS